MPIKLGKGPTGCPMADNLTREQRSYMMSRVRSTDTAPELAVRRMVHARGLRFRKHCEWLPGRPDLVFAKPKVVVFVDGDYWHGWRFPAWKGGLAPYWKEKIERNRRRDRRNVEKLRRSGWIVIRLWEHQVECEPDRCVDRIEGAVRRRSDGAQAIKGSSSIAASSITRDLPSRSRSNGATRSNGLRELTTKPRVRGDNQRAGVTSGAPHLRQSPSP